MPIYEYKCNSCGKKFEKIEKFSDSPLETHDECGGPVERLLSAPTFQFKGSGWYVTDYARANGSAAKHESESKKESAAESKDSKSDSSKSTESSSKSSDGNGAANSVTSSTPAASDKK